MSVKPRTIDNLGIETSSRYARDKELQDTKLIEDSRFIPTKTEVSVLKPYVSLELQEYLLPTSLTLWASFEPPPAALFSGRPLFSHTLIPSLGGAEKQEEDMDKLEALEDTLSKPFKDGRGQDQREQQEEEKERKILMELMKTIRKLDRTLEMINSRRNQYQRG